MSNPLLDEDRVAAAMEEQEAVLLRRRAERLAERRSGAEPADELEVLTFRIGRERFALPVATLRGVAVVDRTTRVPGAAPELLGVIYLRGEIFPLVDTGRLLHSPLDEGGPTRALLCRAPTHLALGVDEICGITRPLRCELRPAETSNASRLVEALLPDHTALLRLEALVAAPALLPSTRR